MCAGASLRCSSRLTAKNKAQSTLHTWVVVDARSVLKHVDLEENESGKVRVRKSTEDQQACANSRHRAAGVSTHGIPEHQHCQTPPGCRRGRAEKRRSASGARVEAGDVMTVPAHHLRQCLQSDTDVRLRRPPCVEHALSQHIEAAGMPSDEAASDGGG